MKNCLACTIFKNWKNIVSERICMRPWVHLASRPAFLYACFLKVRCMLYSLTTQTGTGQLSGKNKNRPDLTSASPVCDFFFWTFNWLWWIARDHFVLKADLTSKHSYNIQVGWRLRIKPSNLPDLQESKGKPHPLQSCHTVGCDPRRTHPDP